MKPGRLDLPTIWRGCTYAAIFLKWRDQDGNPINLTGWTPRAYSRNFNLNAAITNPVQGITRISMSRSQTLPLKLGMESWDWIWIETGTANVSPPLLSGRVEVKDPTTDTTP